MLTLTNYYNSKADRYRLADAGARHDQQYMEAADPVENGAPAPQSM